MSVTDIRSFNVSVLHQNYGPLYLLHKFMILTISEVFNYGWSGTNFR